MEKLDIPVTHPQQNLETSPGLHPLEHLEIKKWKNLQIDHSKLAGGLDFNPRKYQ
jgi:hypothetical protein